MEHFFTPRRPVSARLQGVAGIEAMDWHSRIVADPETFSIALDLVVFDSLALIRTTLSPARIERTPAHVQALRIGTTVYLPIGGRLLFRQGDTRVSAVPGSAVAVTGDLPFEMTVEETAQVIIVVLRRGVLYGQGLPATPTGIRALRATSFLAAVCTFLRALTAELPSPLTQVGVSAQQAVLHLIAGVLADDLDDGARPRRQDAQLAHALSFITANAADSELNTLDVATAAGLSVRHLQRILAAAGTSVAAELRRARLERACATLTDPARRLLSVEDVARVSGFGNLERMRRAFVHGLGVTPAAYRSAGAPRLPTGLAR
ncbi:AraC family transcriptional regulator [Microbacterium hominis]|uniref:AraC family transcriptional regulator n=1 Tax=Microbacterium hominis TaxID=162426 RepID=UPI00168BC49A|nr:AraC family transcriptional regulator [Microbacterium hominis]QOC26741.1 AraC family transcriptional regulator [Microbacterium hominis]QOC27917.1 AraC family transcriptional regulator [Microbacterium hominis]